MANSDTPVLKIPIVGILEMFVVPGPELYYVVYAPMSEWVSHPRVFTAYE